MSGAAFDASWPRPNDQPESGPHDLTELGNAERFAREHGDRFRYVAAWGAWLVWDGRRWARDEGEVQAKRAMKATILGLFLVAGELSGQAAGGNTHAADDASKLTKWARRSSSAPGVRNGLDLARSEPGIAASPNEFDAQPNLLNVENGTIDLVSGKLQPHRPGDMITQLAPVPYDPEAECPTWNKFIEHVIPDSDVRDWLQRFFGYALTGDVSEQIMVILYGLGANGKSTLLNVFQLVLGDYAVQASPGLLVTSNRGDEQARRQRSALRGKRLAVSQEVEAGHPLNEVQVKQLTGGDRITAARLYENESEFTPTHKLVIAANHKPEVRGQDHGIWRRIRLVPFDATIPEAERDPNLPARLAAEAPGILAWMVRGCLDWRERRLADVPGAIRSATEQYRADEDRLAEFLADRTENDPVAFTPIADLHEDYEAWCRDQNAPVLSKRALSSALEERQFRAGRVGSPRARGYFGLRLKPKGGTDGTDL